MMRPLIIGLALTLTGSVAAEQVAPCKQPVAGQLQVFPFDSKIFENTRMLRVWLPARYDDAANSTRRYPVLYMFDGQSLFQARATPEHAHSWSAEEIVTRLIDENKIASVVLVGIDNAGQQRTNEYLPWRDVVQFPEVPAPEGNRMPD